jgi:hypothetical protein
VTKKNSIPLIYNNSASKSGSWAGRLASIVRARVRNELLAQEETLPLIKKYDFPHGARGLGVAWLCEDTGLAHTFVPISFPPDRSYRALNLFSKTATCRCLNRSRYHQSRPAGLHQRLEIARCRDFGLGTVFSPQKPTTRFLPGYAKIERLISIVIGTEKIFHRRDGGGKRRDIAEGRGIGTLITCAMDVGDDWDTAPELPRPNRLATMPVR